jgi:hypothetical protein
MHDFFCLKRFVVLLAIFLTVYSHSVFAQSQMSRDVGLLERERQAESEALEASKRSNEKKALSQLDKVSFEDVLNDPDNIALNFRYAQDQVATNNLLGAATTLERILLVDANQPEVKLFYAVVLYRLDSMAEAKVQFDSLSELKLPKAIANEVKLYQKKIASRSKKLHLAMRQSNGFQYDDNRNVAASSKKSLFGDTLVDLSPSSTKEDDTSFLNITSVDLAYDLPFQAGHQLVTSFDYFLAEQTELDNLDLSAYSWDVGLALKNRWFNVTPKFFAQNVLLSRETFLRTQGGSIELDRSIGRFLLSTRGRLTRNSYSNTTENQTAKERDGDQLDALVKVDYALTKSMTLSLGYTGIDKDAKEEYNAYTGNEVQFGHSWFLGGGQFLLNGVEIARHNYEAPDLALAARERHDSIFRYRLTYGAPLGFFTRDRFLPACLKEITLTVSYEYARSLSNLTNYTYTNNKFQSMLTKTWEF